MPLRVVSDLVLSAGPLSHPGLPYVASLVVRKHQAWATFFCWVGGDKTSCNYGPTPVVGVLSWFVFFLTPFRVFFLMSLALFYNHTYPELVIVLIRKEQEK